MFQIDKTNRRIPYWNEKKKEGNQRQDFERENTRENRKSRVGKFLGYYLFQIERTNRRIPCVGTKEKERKKPKARF